MPAASNPSINRRISFDPKILFISFEMFCPMAGDGFYGWPVVAIVGEMATVGGSRFRASVAVMYARQWREVQRIQGRSEKEGVEVAWELSSAGGPCTQRQAVKRFWCVPFVGRESQAHIRVKVSAVVRVVKLPGRSWLCTCVSPGACSSSNTRARSFARLVGESRRKLDDAGPWPLFHLQPTTQGTPFAKHQQITTKC